MTSTERSLPPALARLVERLDALTDLTSESLARALEGGIHFDDVSEFADFDRYNYRRNLVLRRGGYELRLLCWLPGQRTSLHGHHGSACAFRIMQGTSTEIRLGASDNRWKVDDIIAEKGSNFVHQVTNLADEPLVSLHAYSPPLPVDQPPKSYQGRRIIIIGGGAAGAALAIHLLAGAPRELNLTIVERRQWLGRGPAYGTTDPSFRLNVPAENMSLFSARPADFVEWARGAGESVPRGALLPRRLFGEYVEDRLGAAIAGSAGKVWFHRSAALYATDQGVLLADGRFLEGDTVVLATGNQLPTAPDAFSMEVLRSARVIDDPWTDGALTSIEREEELLIIGTGLTTVDVLQALRNQGHRGRIVAISRRGLLPRPHLDPLDPRRRPMTIELASLPNTARGLSRFLRDEARRLDRDGVGWQCLIDALRPHTTKIWAALPPIERARFMGKLRPFWEVHRHRAAPDSLATLHDWRKAGRLEVIAGNVASVDATSKGLDVVLAPRQGSSQRRHFDRVVLCTGPQTDVRRWRGMLFQNLLKEQSIQADPLGLGILTDDAGRVLDGKGRASPWLYTIGSLRRARLWETTALPDLVRQAEALAALLRGRDPA